MKKIISGLLVHCIVSGVLWGIVNVYQKSYNTLHHDSIRMASMTMQGTQAEIQILHQKWPFQLPDESSPIYYYLFLVTDTPFHCWAYLTDFINYS